MSAATAWRRVGVVAGEEFRRALESRWLFGFTALLTALVVRAVKSSSVHAPVPPMAAPASDAHGSCMVA